MTCLAYVLLPNLDSDKRPKLFLAQITQGVDIQLHFEHRSISQWPWFVASGLPPPLPCHPGTCFGQLERGMVRTCQKPFPSTTWRKQDEKQDTDVKPSTGGHEEVCLVEVRRHGVSPALSAVCNPYYLPLAATSQPAVRALAKKSASRRPAYLILRCQYVRTTGRYLPTGFAGAHPSTTASGFDVL